MATRQVRQSTLKWTTVRDGKTIGGTVLLPTVLGSMVIWHVNGDVVTYIVDPTIALKERSFRLVSPGQNYDNGAEAPLGSTGGRTGEAGLLMYTTA